MLLFVDGFDHYATADISKKYTNVAGAIEAANGRRGTGNIRFAGNVGSLSKAFVNSQTIILGVAFKVDGYASVWQIRFWEGANAGPYIYFASDGSVRFVDCASTNHSSATGLVSLNTWHYLEVKLYVHDTAGTVEIRLNGVAVLSLTNKNTKVSANAYVNSVYFIGLGSINLYLDDLYICDTTGSDNNNFLGDCRVDTILASSDGNYQEFTPSTGTSHYPNVDDPTPNTTDYNYSSTVGHREVYGMQDPTTLPGSVYGIQVNLAAAKDDAGTRGIKALIRSGTTDQLGGTEFALSTGQVIYTTVYERDPATSAAWLQAGLNALQAGAQITL